MKLENGLSPEKIAKSMQRVYAICTLGDLATQDVLEDLEITQGWVAVTDFILTTYGASAEAESSFTPNEFGELMYKAFGRGMENDRQEPFEKVPAREQLAWEIVARHSAFVTQAEEDDLDNLGDIERKWGQKFQEFARTRGVTLEQAEAATR